MPFTSNLSYHPGRNFTARLSIQTSAQRPSGGKGEERTHRRGIDAIDGDGMSSRSRVEEGSQKERDV